jgi:hypothetical protein
MPTTLELSGEEAFARRQALSLSGEDAFARRQALSLSGADAFAQRQQLSAHPNAGAQIMAKMGWSEGQGTPACGAVSPVMLPVPEATVNRPAPGLGRDQRGISSALDVDVTRPGHGRIVAPPAATATPTNVVLLKVLPGRVSSRARPFCALHDAVGDSAPQNLVGPGEVDEDLQPETAEECSKFGPVRSCLVYECPRGTVPDEEAVRVFVAFEAQQAASDGKAGRGNARAAVVRPDQPSAALPGSAGPHERALLRRAQGPGRILRPRALCQV